MPVPQTRTARNDSILSSTLPPRGGLSGCTFGGGVQSQSPAIEKLEESVARCSHPLTNT